MEVSFQIASPAALFLEKIVPVPNEQEAVRSSHLVWTIWRTEGSFFPAGNGSVIPCCPFSSLDVIPGRR